MQIKKENPTKQGNPALRERTKVCWLRKVLQSLQLCRLRFLNHPRGECCWTGEQTLQRLSLPLCVAQKWSTLFIIVRAVFHSSCHSMGLFKAHAPHGLLWIESLVIQLCTGSPQVMTGCLANIWSYKQTEKRGLYNLVPKCQWSCFLHGHVTKLQLLNNTAVLRALCSALQSHDHILWWFCENWHLLPILGKIAPFVNNWFV